MATENLKKFPDPQKLYCPHCTKPVMIYDPEGSEYLVCTECWSYLRWHPEKQGIQTLEPLKQIKYEHILDPGSVGNLKGRDYKVLAYLEKKEAGNEYEWREYMLWSYEKGYAFLAEYNGHWSFVAGIQHFPDLKDVRLEGGTAWLGDNEYHEFNRYTPIITAMTGEFDWNVHEERIGAREFVCPPLMLVRERNNRDKTIVDWYLGEYITPDEIAAAFKIGKEKFPDVVDIGANQPNPNKLRYKQTLRISIAAAILMVFIQIVYCIVRPGQTLLNGAVPLVLPPPKADSAHQDSAKKDSITYSWTPQNTTYEFLPQRTQSFTIGSGPAPVDVYLYGAVDNSWMESTVELVSEKDNQTWVVDREVDYYHGYDDGDYWSEGSHDVTITLDDIPAGRYHINVYPYTGTEAITEINLRVSSNVILWQNILITLLVLILAPLAFWYFQRRFEVNRWMNSDFSPYNKTDNSDD
jgi:hypothetical protein